MICNALHLTEDQFLSEVLEVTGRFLFFLASTFPLATSENNAVLKKRGILHLWCSVGLHSGAAANNGHCMGNTGPTALEMSIHSVQVHTGNV